MTERSRAEGKERIVTLLVLVCLEQGKLMSGADLDLGLRWAEFCILALVLVGGFVLELLP